MPPIEMTARWAVGKEGSATRNFVSKYLMFLSYPAQQDLYGWIVGHFNRHYLAAIIQFKFDFLSFRFDFHLVAGERPIGFHQSLRFLNLGFGTVSYTHLRAHE